jgi:hypothetical protein
MGGGHKINVMATVILQDQHHASQLPESTLLSVSLVTDIVILAKITFQVTVGEKNGAGAKSPDQWRFFPKVGIKTGNNRFFSGRALTQLSGKTVDLTRSRTNLAGF